MATKTYKPRLDFRLLAELHELDATRYSNAVNVRQWLWDTHVVFNSGVDYLAGWLLRMHRGAGVWRQRKDGIWGPWENISTHAQLCRSRVKLKSDPRIYALIENHTLLKHFMDHGKTEKEAVELAECCRTIVSENCPPSEERSEAPMPRDDLDLLTNKDSEAKGIRPRSVGKSGTTKKTSGKRPGWILEKAVYEETASAHSLDELFSRLSSREEFISAKKDGNKRIAKMREKFTGESWAIVQAAICALDPKIGKPKWEVTKNKLNEKRQESETSGAIAAYRRLFECGCLPLPGLNRPTDFFDLKGATAEWNYGMWDMAGQRVRSHLGWIRRRAGERLLWERKKKLFEEGGWMRTTRDSKKIKEKLNFCNLVFQGRM